jgi:hypothetical protein
MSIACVHSTYIVAGGEIASSYVHIVKQAPIDDNLISIKLKIIG